MNPHFQPPEPSTGILKFTGISPLAMPPEPRPGVSSESAPKIRILVAEDDPISRELLTTRLIKWGYDPLVTTNGVEAMQELRKPSAPSLAILD